MSDTAKRLFESLRAASDVAQAIAPGLKSFGPEVKAEMSRMGTQGAMELASALFNGDGFVPYGPGQYTPSAEQEHKHEHDLSIER